MNQLDLQDEINILRQRLKEAERATKLCYCCNQRLDEANDALYTRLGKPTYEQLEQQLNELRWD